MKKVVLITGVAGGIGAATARLFHKERWRVIGLDRKTPPRGVPLLHFIQADLSDTGEISRAVSVVEQEVSRIDSLVNNAAMQICESVILTSESHWDRVMSANVKAAFLLAKACFSWLKVSGGNIVNVASVHALATSRYMAAYAASKGALVSLTRALAVEFASSCIRVNAVLPGAVDTPMLREGLRRSGRESEVAKKRLAASIPLKRIGQPEEIAEGILFLASNARSSLMTGQCLVLDGGATCVLSTENER